MSGLRATLGRMNPTRPVALIALAVVLPLVFAGCGNKGPLVRASPVPATIDGTPTIDAPVEGEAAPDDDTGVQEATVDGVTLEDTDPSDEISLPEEDVTSESEVAPPEDEPTPEPAPEPVPPAEDPNG